MPEPIIVYADTSVFGGVFDDAFTEASTRFFDLVRVGRFKLMLSGIVQAELSVAPHNVQDFLDGLLPLTEDIPVTPGGSRVARRVPCRGHCHAKFFG